MPASLANSRSTQGLYHVNNRHGSVGALEALMLTRAGALIRCGVCPMGRPLVPKLTRALRLSPIVFLFLTSNQGDYSIR